MSCFRFFLSLALVGWVTGIGDFATAQETEASPISITLAPVQYADVKGNVSNFRALNWMKDGGNAGVSDITFIHQINKDTSLEMEGSVFAKTEDNDGHLILKKGDLAFLKIDYTSFRKYYETTGGVYPYPVSGSSIAGLEQGAKLNSPNLQMDISFFKLEAGLGEINDPFLDVVYEHDSKDGDKSLLQWSPAFNSANTAYRLIGPSYAAVNDTSDTVTLKEKKDIAGITVKGEQKAEIDYNHNITYMPFLNATPATASIYNQIQAENESLDAKLFGSGVRLEKWLFNDNSFAGLGYHYNHTHDTDLMQNTEANSVTGILTNYAQTNPVRVSLNQSLWSYAHALEDDHVWTGNFNTNLTPSLTFLSDVRYEHLGSEGDSTYYPEGPAGTSNGIAPNGSTTSVNYSAMENHQDHEGEHVALRYSGIPHTSLYAESDLEQARNQVSELFDNLSAPWAPGNTDFTVDRLNRTQKESWTLGGRIVPNRFFIFSTQVKQRWEDNEYDTISVVGTPTDQIFLDALKINSLEETSTLTWKPYRWIQNSLKYQFYDTDYMPRQAAEGTLFNQYNISENHMLTSRFTYDITVEPIDPVILMISYSHTEDYVRTLGASSAGGEYIPTFNSGDNSWLFSGSYTPMENLTLTNTVCYTLSPNYVDFSTGVPYGSSFKQLTFSTGLQWKYHKWLKINPTYEYASYRGNSLVDDGSYSANIFQLKVGFDW